MMKAILSLCEASMESGRGVTLYFGNHSIPMVVTKIEGLEYVEGRSQEFDRIVVLLPHVTAACA